MRNNNKKKKFGRGSTVVIITTIRVCVLQLKGKRGVAQILPNGTKIK